MTVDAAASAHAADGTAGKDPTLQDARAASDALLADVVRRLAAALAPERIYLFGSRARGDFSAQSDYDVCVLVRERTGRGHAMERLAYAALSGLGVPVDIVIVSSADFDWLKTAAASLPATVAREGRLLYAA